MTSRLPVFVSALLVLACALAAPLPAAAPTPATDLPDAAAVFDYVQLQNNNPGGPNFYQYSVNAGGHCLDMRGVAMLSQGGPLNGVYRVHIIIRRGDIRLRIDTQADFVNGNAKLVFQKRNAQPLDVVSVYVSTPN